MSDFSDTNVWIDLLVMNLSCAEDNSTEVIIGTSLDVCFSIFQMDKNLMISLLSLLLFLFYSKNEETEQVNQGYVTKCLAEGKNILSTIKKRNKKKHRV